MNEEYLAHIIEKYRLDYIVHGDDPCIVDGKDVYESARKLGKYKTITRTEGISTTDIVGRMLLMTKSHHRHAPLLGDQTVNQADRMRLSSSSSNMLEFEDEIQEEHEPVARNSQFLTTLSLMRQFSQGNRPQPPDARVVYLMGSWDMFHAGHIATLRKARHYGDFVLVGIHSDATVNHTRGMNLPIQTQHERVLSVLGCKYVDDVLIDAPEIIDKDLISRLNICKVVRGEVSEVSYMPNAEESGAYVVAEEMGVLEVVPSDFTLTDAEIVARIQKQRGTMEARYERKIALEESYYKKKGLDLYNSQINT
jgi:ethanolamine-phosphate cytidylyltransferase